MIETALIFRLLRRDDNLLRVHNYIFFKTMKVNHRIARCYQYAENKSIQNTDCSSRWCASQRLKMSNLALTAQRLRQQQSSRLRRTAHRGRRSEAVAEPPRSYFSPPPRPRSAARAFPAGGSISQRGAFRCDRGCHPPPDRDHLHPCLRPLRGLALRSRTGRRP